MIHKVDVMVNNAFHLYSFTFPFHFSLVFLLEFRKQHFDPQAEVLIYTLIFLSFLTGTMLVYVIFKSNQTFWIISSTKPLCDINCLWVNNYFKNKMNDWFYKHRTTMNLMKFFLKKSVSKEGRNQTPYWS